MEHFGAVFKLDLTEEIRTQLQEEETIASSYLIYWLRLWSWWDFYWVNRRMCNVSPRQLEACITQAIISIDHHVLVWWRLTTINCLRQSATQLLRSRKATAARPSWFAARCFVAADGTTPLFEVRPLGLLVAMGTRSASPSILLHLNSRLCCPRANMQSISHLVEHTWARACTSKDAAAVTTAWVHRLNAPLILCRAHQMRYTVRDGHIEFVTRLSS